MSTIRFHKILPLITATGFLAWSCVARAALADGAELPAAKWLPLLHELTPTLAQKVGARDAGGPDGAEERAAREARTSLRYALISAGDFSGADALKTGNDGIDGVYGSGGHALPIYGAEVRSLAGDRAGAQAAFAKATALARFEYSGSNGIIGDVGYLTELGAAEAKFGDPKSAALDFERVRVAVEKDENIEVHCVALGRLLQTEIEVKVDAGRAAALVDLLSSAHRLTDAHRQVRTYNSLARFQAQSGDTAGALTTFGLAKDAARSLATPDARAGALIEIALYQLSWRKGTDPEDVWGEAVQATLAFPGNALRADHLMNFLSIVPGDGKGKQAPLSTSEVKARIALIERLLPAYTTASAKLDGLLTAFREIPMPPTAAAQAATLFARARKSKERLSPDTTYRLANAQAAAGDFTQARRTASLVTDTYSRAYLLSRIAVAQAYRGDVTAAKRFAAQTGSPENVAQALTGIAATQAARGDESGARVTLREARQSALRIAEAWQRSFRLDAVALSQSKAGDRDEAGATWDLASRAAQRRSPFSGGDGVRALGLIVDDQIEAGEKERAAANLQTIAARTLPTTDINTLTAAVVRVARREHKIGDDAAARANLRAAYDRALVLEARHDSSTDFWFVESLNALAKAQMEADDVLGATATFRRAIAAMQTETQRQIHGSRLALLARTLQSSLTPSALRQPLTDYHPDYFDSDLYQYDQENAW